MFVSRTLKGRPVLVAIDSAPQTVHFIGYQERLGSTTGKRANRDEVLVAHPANVVHSERQQCMHPARSGDELDLKAIRFVDLHDRPEISPAQTMLRQVAVENDGIEILESHGAKSAPGILIGGLRR